MESLVRTSCPPWIDAILTSDPSVLHILEARLEGSQALDRPHRHIFTMLHTYHRTHFTCLRSTRSHPFAEFHGPGTKRWIIEPIIGYSYHRAPARISIIPSPVQPVSPYVTRGYLLARISAHKRLHNLHTHDRKSVTRGTSSGGNGEPIAAATV